MKTKIPDYYELPCFPDKQPREHRRTIVNVHSGWMGKKNDHVVFIGGGGVATFTTRAKAIEAVQGLVEERLEDRVRGLHRQLEYAKEQLRQWRETPWAFAMKEPE